MSRPKSIIVANKEYRILSRQYYEYQKRIGYVKETCRTRQLNVNEFLSYIEQKGIVRIKEITHETIQSFYRYISERPNKQGEGILSQKTIYDFMKSLDLFFIMLQETARIQFNPVSTLQLRHPATAVHRDILSQTQIKTLYEVCLSALERSILSLGYGCGLRVGEMERLNIEDVKLREKIVIIPRGKGNKRRVIPMSNGVAKDLKEYYFEEREILTSGRDYREQDRAFMLNSRGGRMREYTYNKHLKKLIARTKDKTIQSKTISMHSLRHSIATHLIEQGIPVEQVRQFLGHSQLETTQIYTRISTKQIKELIN